SVGATGPSHKAWTAVRFRRPTSHDPSGPPAPPTRLGQRFDSVARRRTIRRGHRPLSQGLDDGSIPSPAVARSVGASGPSHKAWTAVRFRRTTSHDPSGPSAPLTRVVTEYNGFLSLTPQGMFTHQGGEGSTGYAGSASR